MLADYDANTTQVNSATWSDPSLNRPMPVLCAVLLTHQCPGIDQLKEKKCRTITVDSVLALVIAVIVRECESSD